MSHQSDPISTDINAYWAQHERKELACSKVDDGMSTLIGRLLHDYSVDDIHAAFKNHDPQMGNAAELSRWLGAPILVTGHFETGCAESELILADSTLDNLIPDWILSIFEASLP
ncbi:MAG: hypothetical protein Q8S55_04360 [Methylococcaceae bacterium]|nr:hypothetical protein [Methylococcaceae bacterium]